MIIAVNRDFTSHGRIKQVIVGLMDYALQHPEIKLYFPDSHLLVKQQAPEQIDGIIGPHTETLNNPGCQAIPNINVLAYPGQSTIQVISDEEAIGRMAFNCFRELGLRHLAVLDSARLKGMRCKPFVEACREEGFIPYIFKYGGRHIIESQEHQRARLLRQLHSLPKPAGLFLTLDVHASTIVELCAEAGIRVPQDMVLLGCDNDTELCMNCVPQLTSIDIDAERIGYKAMQNLASLVNGKAVPDEILIPPREIIVRASTNFILNENSNLTKVLDYIHANLAEPLEVEDLLSQQQLGRRTFERQFRSYCGETPWQYLLSLRFQKIRHLLETTTLSVAEIGCQCGIPDANYLCRLFKKRHGITPRQFRRAAHNQAGRVISTATSLA